MTEYRIDDLAREAGTTTRNVRGYQDRGLLPRPARRGRIAIYTDVHLARLKVINDLLKRGFTIRHIGDFLSGMQRGDDLVEVLGLEEIVTEPWSTATSTSMAVEDLEELLNTQNPAHFERLIEFGLIEPQESDRAPDCYTIRDQETVSAYGRLVKLGLPLGGILDAHGRLDRQMAAVAETVISAGRLAFTEGHADGWLPQTTAESEWATELLSELRKATTVSAHNALNRALDRDLARQVNDYMGRARKSAAEQDDSGKSSADQPERSG